MQKSKKYLIIIGVLVVAAALYFVLPKFIKKNTKVDKMANAIENKFIPKCIEEIEKDGQVKTVDTLFYTDNSSYVEVFDKVVFADGSSSDYIYDVYYDDSCNITSISLKNKISCVYEPFKNDATILNIKGYDEYGNLTEYRTLEDAHNKIDITILTDYEAKALAAYNKNKYAAKVDELIDLINEYRVSKGLPKCTKDSNLIDAAMHRAAESAYANWDMIATGTANSTISNKHIRPNLTGAGTIIKEYSIKNYYGENYAKFYKNCNSVFEGWKGSPSHNGLMLEKVFTKIGIGMAEDSKGRLYWIAAFS